MKKKLTQYDVQDIFRQLRECLEPSKVVDVAIDKRRMIAYVAVAFYGNARGNDCMPDGDVYALVAPIYEADDDDRLWARHRNFVVTSDEMPAESMGICEMEQYCHCPARILKQLSTPRYWCSEANERAIEWRQICKQNAKRK